MIRLSHFYRPIRSANTLFHRVSLLLKSAERRIRDIRRENRDLCWCGGSLISFKWHQSYGVCVNCGCYVNKRPPKNLSKLYSRDFYWYYIQKYHGFPSLESRAELYEKDGRLAYWLQIIRRYGTSQGIVIEAGCAPGILLKELKIKGYKCIGVEPDKKTVNWIQKSMEVSVRTGLFPDVELPNCDIFLAFDVLEHSSNPDGFMRGVTRLLNPGGVAIIQTPVDRYGYNPPFGDQSKKAFLDYEHLFLFTNRAMTLLAERSGLKVVSLDERWALFHEISVFMKPCLWMGC